MTETLHKSMPSTCIDAAGSGPGTVQQRYARAFSEFMGGGRAFCFWKGRVAEYALLKALGVGPGDEVIVPGYTCVVAMNPIKYAGATPVYLDIEPHTFNIDVSQLPAKLTPRTKLIIAQHTYGYPVDMEPVLDIAQRHGIPVIEDCCLALGSRYKGQLCGTMGLAAYFSSQWNKPYTTGLGGIALCHNKALADKVEDLCTRELQAVPFRTSTMMAAQLAAYRTLVFPRTTGAIRHLFRWLVRHRILVGSTEIKEKLTIRKGDDFFMGMSRVQARAGLRQVAKADRNIVHRCRMAALYDALLGGAGFPARQVAGHSEPVLVRYPLRVSNKWEMVEDAVQHGHEIGSWFEAPLHPRETAHELYGYHPGMCPEAEKACREVINLPLHPRTSEQVVRRTAEYVISCSRRQG